jgi:hypothetical protein
MTKNGRLPRLISILIEVLFFILVTGWGSWSMAVIEKETV